MASNIRVVLEADNKKYLTDIRDAESATKQFAKTAETSTDAARAAFAKMQGALAAIGFGSLISHQLEYARGVSQASAATNVAVDSIHAFAEAVGAAGGDINRATGDVIDFVAGLSDAKQGSAGAQIALSKVGISLKDLSTLSNQDLFKQTVQGLAKIEDASLRNRLAVQLLGRSFKDIDVRQVAADMKSTLSSGVDTQSITAAAQAQQNLAREFNKFGDAVLKAMRPLNEFIASISIAPETFDKLVSAAKAAIEVLGLFYIGGKVASVLKALWEIITIIGVSLGEFGSLAINALRNWSSFITVIKDGGGIFRSILVAITAVGEEIGIALAPALKALAPAFAPLAAAAAATFEYIDSGFSSLIEKSKQLITALSFGTINFGAQGGSNEKDSSQRKKEAEEAAAAEQKVVDAFRAQKLELDKIVIAYKHQNDLGYDQLNFQTSLIGKTEEEKEKKTKLYEAEMKYLEQLYALDQKEAELRRAAAVGTDEEKATYAAYAASKGQAVAKITEEYESQKVALSRLIDRNQGAMLIEKDRLANIENMTRAMEAQLKVQEALTGARLSIIGQGQDVKFAGSQIGKSDLQKQMAEITETNRKAGLEASRAFAAAFEDGGDGLTPEKSKQLADGLKAIEEGYKGITNAQLENVKASRTWSTGWDEAFANYKDSAQNAAEQSRTYFNTFTKGVEDAIVTFVQTGKLSFKDLANNLIAEFARIQARKLLTGLFGGGSGGGISDFFAAISGKAIGGPVSANTPYMVGERGPELFLPRSAGTIVPNNQLSGSTNVTYNINAVDASSFRQMLAREPEFLYAVTQKGANSIPGGRR